MTCQLLEGQAVEDDAHGDNAAGRDRVPFRGGHVARVSGKCCSRALCASSLTMADRLQGVVARLRIATVRCVCAAESRTRLPTSTVYTAVDNVEVFTFILTKRRYSAPADGRLSGATRLGSVMVIEAPRHTDVCGFKRGVLVCESEPHPQHPNAHVYVSNVGSHVADRHGGTS